MGQSKTKKPHWYSNRINCVYILIFLFNVGCANNASHIEQEDLYLSQCDYDFGIIPDSISEVKHSFFIVNNSSDICKIENIEKSCGCTDIKVSSKIINPHDSISFEVVLNVGSNYSFMERDVNFYFENKEQPLTLYIRATRNVPQFLIKKEFPFKLSKNLALSGYSAILGYVQHGQEKSVSLNILNTSNKSKHIELKSKVPKGFDIIYPTSIQPQEISRIVICCNLKEKLYGEISFDCLFEEDGIMTNPFKVYVVATEKFGRNYSVTPRICIPTSAYNSNLLDSGDVKFMIVNVGNDTLFFRKIESSKSFVKTAIDKRFCLPHDSCYLTIRKTDNEVKITDDIILGLTTNDRIEPYRQLKIIAPYNP